MIEKFRRLTSKKYFHVVVLIFVVVIILFTAGVIILKYNVEGETNMPFDLKKISIISSSEGIDKQATDTKWAFDIYQSNDIYLYIDKNKNYNQSETIKNILIDNIQIEAKNTENIKIYKPDNQDEKLIFKNTDENIVENIEFTGELESDLKNLKIANQGGLLAFRCSNNNITEYTSNDEEIVHNQLLKKAGILQEDLKINLSFDLSITLENGKEYKTNIFLDLPVEDIIEQGTGVKEITDASHFVFKRIKN